MWQYSQNIDIPTGLTETSLKALSKKNTLPKNMRILTSGHKGHIKNKKKWVEKKYFLSLKQI